MVEMQIEPTEFIIITIVTETMASIQITFIRSILVTVDHMVVVSAEEEALVIVVVVVPVVLAAVAASAEGETLVVPAMAVGAIRVAAAFRKLLLHFFICE